MPFAVGQDGILRILPPLGRLGNLIFECEHVTPEDRSQLFALQPMMLRDRQGEFAQEPLFFLASDGRWGGHSVNSSACYLVQP